MHTHTPPPRFGTGTARAQQAIINEIFDLWRYQLHTQKFTNTGEHHEADLQSPVEQSTSGYWKQPAFSCDAQTHAKTEQSTILSFLYRSSSYSKTSK